MTAFVAVAVATIALSGGPAHAGTVTGSPQPELAPFRIGPSAGPGSVAIEPDGSLVVAYQTGTSTMRICVLHRGANRCAVTTTLTAVHGDSVFGPTQVYATSNNDLYVLQNGCCTEANGDELWTSTTGGRSFTGPALVGSVGVDGSALTSDGQLVFGASHGLDGVQLQSVSLTSPTVDTETANPDTREVEHVAISGYHGGVLVADDDGTNTWVYYAKSGSAFDSTAAYHRVGTFAGQDIISVSGAALVTRRNAGNSPFELYSFNGTGYGPAATVPHDADVHGPAYVTVDRDPAGTTHVFSVIAPKYHLNEESTTSGKSWTAQTELGNVGEDDYFAVDLDKIGSGLVLGNNPATGYPVLAEQHVSFTLHKTTVGRHHTVHATGTVSQRRPGHDVLLQIGESHKRWKTVRTTHESSSGTFSFTIGAASVGRFSYRVEVPFTAGYVQYGYSAARTLHVAK